MVNPWMTKKRARDFISQLTVAIFSDERPMHYKYCETPLERKVVFTFEAPLTFHVHGCRVYHQGQVIWEQRFVVPIMPWRGTSFTVDFSDVVIGSASEGWRLKVGDVI